jgi:hypothetical protein
MRGVLTLLTLVLLAAVAAGCGGASSSPTDMANATSKFRAEVSQVCALGKAELGPHTYSDAEAQNRNNVRRLNALTAPPSVTSAWAAYMATVRTEQRPFKDVLAALRAHEVARAYQFNAETKAMQRSANVEAKALGLDACVVPLSSG